MSNTQRMNQFVIQPPAISPLANTNTTSSSHGGSPHTHSPAHRTTLGTMNLPETIKQIEHQITILGPGPHTPTQSEQLGKLTVFLHRARADLHKQHLNTKPSLPQPQFTDPPVTTQAGMSTPSPSASKPTPIVPTPSTAGSDGRVLDRRRLQDLVKEVDPLEQLEEEVEEVLLQLADDFIEGVVTNACHLAKHRKSNTLEVKDVKLHLEKNWNMVIPGYGTDDVRTYKKACTTEAHKQRMSLIRKTLKKY